MELQFQDMEGNYKTDALAERGTGFIKAEPLLGITKNTAKEVISIWTEHVSLIYSSDTEEPIYSKAFIINYKGLCSNP